MAEPVSDMVSLQTGLDSITLTFTSSASTSSDIVSISMPSSDSNVSIVNSLFILSEFSVAVNDQTVIAFDAEGVNLSRVGAMTVASVGVQMTSGVHVYLFDILQEDLDLRDAQNVVLKKVFEDETIIKIVHDCRQDSDALKAQLGIHIANVFDTSIYGMMLEKTERRFNLNTALRQYNCIVNENREEVVDLYGNNPSFWSTRPLTPFMTNYASKDVASLFDLRLRLLEKVAAETMPGSSLIDIQAASEAAASEYRAMMVHEMVEVPKTHKGCIIGKGGSGIAAIERDSGARITGSMETSFLLLAHTQGQMDRAKEMIQQALDKYDRYLLRQQGKTAATDSGSTSSTTTSCGVVHNSGSKQSSSSSASSGGRRSNHKKS